MRPLLSSFVLLTLALAACSSTPPLHPAPAETAASSPRRVEGFDGGWRFLQGEAPDAFRPEFSDTSWRSVDLPHDWSIAGPFDGQHRTGGSGGFLPAGVAWYRKSFSLPAGAEGQRVFVEFDGIMENSDVWVNGHLLGHRPNGYVSLRYDLTPHLVTGPGARNVIAVRADNSPQPASRWYTGAGIYRHVRLVTTGPIHVVGDSAFVSARFEPAESGGATTRIEADVVNLSSAAREVALRVTLRDPSGHAAGTADLKPQSAAPRATTRFSAEIRVAQPARWDVSSPQLYHAELTVHDGPEILDRQDVAFGLRSAEFDANHGFVLNNRRLKLLGVCLHHDGGAFGAAVPLAVWEQRLATLRTLGVNAIRTAHNPPDPAFLSLCDRMGFLVMDELFDCWTVGKRPHDYHQHFNTWSKTDVRDTVRRDRNHPSVVIYSAGNEIHDTPRQELAKQILSGLVEVFHANDPTRPVTQALFRPNVSHDYTNGLADLLDVVGTNYRDPELLAAWRDRPTRKILGTEQRHDRETWLALRDHPQHSGQFLWSGIDYLGEAWRWPQIGNASGLLDRIGAVKPIGRERQSWWSPRPMVAITRRIGREALSPYDPGYEPVAALRRRRQVLFADWSPTPAGPHEEDIEVYSNAESVELFLNGQSLGAKPLNPDASPRTWTVLYVPGTLRAVARNGGQEVATDTLTTAGAPARLVLTADRDGVGSAWDDVVRLTATVVDANGVPVPSANHTVTFSIDGPGAVVAVDNGDNTSHEPFQATRRSAYQGRCVAFVRATADHGAFTIHAVAEGLATGTTRLSVVPPTAQP